MTTKYSGADWVEAGRKHWKDQDKPMSELGRKVADLLGQVYAGIYHISREASRVDWTDPERIEIVIHDGRGFSTYDGNELTNLVLLCHLMDVRLDIDAAAYRYIRLIFMPVTRRGFFRVGHPCLDEAIKTAQELVP